MSQSKHSTSQWIGRALTRCGRSRKHRIEITISKSIVTPLVSPNEQNIFIEDKRLKILKIDAKQIEAIQ